MNGGKGDKTQTRRWVTRPCIASVVAIRLEVGETQSNASCGTRARKKKERRCQGNADLLLTKDAMTCGAADAGSCRSGQRQRLNHGGSQPARSDDRGPPVTSPPPPPNENSFLGNPLEECSPFVSSHLSLGLQHSSARIFFPRLISLYDVRSLPARLCHHRCCDRFALARRFRCLFSKRTSCDAAAEWRRHFLCGAGRRIRGVVRASRMSRRIGRIPPRRRPFRRRPAPLSQRRPVASASVDPGTAR